MSLEEVQEELRKQIAELEEEEVTEDVTEEEDPIKEEPSDSEVEPEEEKKDEPKEEKPEEPEEPKEPEKKSKTNADFARERRERVSEAKRLREELEEANRRIQELSQPKSRQDIEPDRDEDPSAWQEWRANQAEKKAEQAIQAARDTQEILAREQAKKQQNDVYNQARNELIEYEADARKAVADYDKVRAFMLKAEAFRAKLANPTIKPQELAREVERQLLFKASKYYNEGHENPALAIYDEAISLGYKEAPEESSKTPDLEKVAKNRSRNSGMAGANSGGGHAQVTKRYAATEMTSAEWAKLPTAERERIMRQEA